MNSKELLFAKSHEWVKFIDDTTALIGITDHAQDALGDIVFINLPEVGDSVEAGEVFADLESVKAVSDIYSPVTGEITKVNETLCDSPELINSDPYGSFFIEVSNITAKEELLTKEEYEAMVSEEE